jgi:hypothetical protein
MRNLHPETHPFDRPSILLIHEPSLHTKRTRGVSHCDLAIHIKKYVKAKEELWKLKYFTTQKI